MAALKFNFISNNAKGLKLIKKKKSNYLNIVNQNFFPVVFFLLKKLV